MVLLFQSHPNARKVDGTVRGYVKISVNQLSLILFLERFWYLGVSGLGWGPRCKGPLPLVESWSMETLYLHLVFIQMFSWAPALVLESRELGSFCSSG